MRKIIGIDIDGVITDEIHENKNIWHNALCNYLGYHVDMVKESYYFDQAYDLPMEIIDSFLEEKIEEIYSNVKIDQNAQKTINYLYQRDFEIHLITARDKKHQQITEKWIVKNKVEYSSLSHEEDKAPLAVEKNIQLFIEDHAKNALSISQQGIKVLLLNKYHNQHFKENKDLISRVNDWCEIKIAIDKFFSLQ
ncbi:MAG: hypothetical protein ACOCRO_06045 [Halanaerobiales bacterium]